MSLSIKKVVDDDVFRIEITTMVDEKPFLATVGVRTFNFVFVIGTFPAHVTTEVTPETGPQFNRTVPGVFGAFKMLRNF